MMPMTGFAVGAEAEHAEDAMRTLDVMLSDEALQLYSETNRVISPSKNVEVECIPALKPLNDRIQADVYVLGSNAGMKVEQWGNTCQIVRQLLGGATVEECMAEFDRLQAESRAYWGGVSEWTMKRYLRWALGRCTASCWIRRSGRGGRKRR